MTDRQKKLDDRQKKLDAITDAIYYHMVELVSLANQVEAIGLDKDGDNLRTIADQLERLGIRLLNKTKRHRA